MKQRTRLAPFPHSRPDEEMTWV